MPDDSYPIIRGRIISFEHFRNPKGGGGESIPPAVRNPAGHRERLLNAIDGLVRQVADREPGERDQDATREIVTIRGREDAPLEADSLSDTKTDARRVFYDEERNLTVIDTPDPNLPYIRRKLDRFADGEVNEKGLRRHQKSIAPLDTIGLATDADLSGPRVRSAALEPDDDRWFEIACRGGRRRPTAESESSRNQVLRQLDHLGRPVPQEYLATEHIVFFVRASLAQVRQLIEAVDCVYEFDLALPAVRDWLTLETEPDQPPPSLRLEPPSGDSPTVALLDTGIASQHPLIAGALLSATSVDPFDNSAEDVFGHGSNMAGPALYSDLGRALDLGEYKATHWIQSVKLFRRPNEGSASAASQAYWPSQTERAVEAAEASSDGQPCAFVLAVTSEVNDMQPTFWSHAVDRLCYNDGNGRLLLVSAGNADATRVDLVTAYPELHKDERIQEPAQSGNALTVGAFTDRTVIPPDKDLEWFAPVAPRGGVSPYTTAGAIGGAPIKPEIVFEGGNLAFDGVLPSAIPTLGALTTGHEPAQHPLTWFWGTSEATARCSYLAAQIWAQTPDFRAESVRALIVHSASWTPAMTSQLPNLDERLALCGYGVPDSEFARSCATERATVLVEDAMPNALEESVPRKVPPKLSTTPATQIAYRRIAKFFSLPIPDRLHELDDQEIELRVTLSYFPEPNIERRRGYNGLDLKWDMQGPNESEVEFRQRINRLARTAGKKATWSGSFPWEVGIERRSRGTVQSDRWRGLASLLEESRLIAVYPVLGWWERRASLRTDLMPFSLVVTLLAPGVDVYTSIRTAIEPTVEVES